MLDELTRADLRATGEETATFLRDVMGLDDDLEGLLLETALLGRHTGPLCHAMIGRTARRRRLERLVRQNVFTQAPDERRTTFHDHALLADAPRRRVAILPPDHVRPLQARAGRRHAAQDDVDSAVRHLVAVDALDEAAALVECAALRSFRRDGPTPWSNWLAAFPDASLAGDPRLAIAALRASLTFLYTTLQQPLGAAKELAALADPALARLGPDQGWQRGTLLVRLGVVGATNEEIPRERSPERTVTARPSRAYRDLDEAVPPFHPTPPRPPRPQDERRDGRRRAATREPVSGPTDTAPPARSYAGARGRR